MGNKLIVFSNQINDEWLNALVKAWQPYGGLAVLKEKDSVQHQQMHASLIIIDASTIRTNIGNFVSHLMNTFGQIPVVVITTSPTWRRAREAFLAGAADFVRRTNDVGKLRAMFAKTLPAPSL